MTWGWPLAANQPAIDNLDQFADVLRQAEVDVTTDFRQEGRRLVVCGIERIDHKTERTYVPPADPATAPMRTPLADATAGTQVPDIVMGVAAGATAPELYTIDRPGPGRLSTMMRPDGFGALGHVLAALRTAGVDVLVSLLAEEEAEEEGLAYEAELAKAHGLTFYHLPTKDHHAPDRDATAALAKTLQGHLSHGDSVVVHCWAGIGRSSTVAAATLLLEGYEPGAAWRVISAARGREVPDQQSQLDLIDELWS